MTRHILSVVFSVSLSSVCLAQQAKLTPDAAKELLPQAAGIADADFEALSKDPRPDAVESKSLSLILFSLDAPTIGERNPAAAQEFRYLGNGFPRPSELAAAMRISKNKGYVTFLRPDYIDDCTCESTAERAEGIVAFRSKLFAGRIPFVAKPIDGVWTITEFRLPQYMTKVVRGDDGVWKQESPTGK